MLPTIAQAPPAQKHFRHPARRVSCAAIDALLFEPESWFALDASNRRVPGVTPASLEAALGLIGHCGIATVVGRTRKNVLVIDIDVDGVIGDAVAEQVVAWCSRRDVWWLMRPSGGSHGRAHVFTAAADEAALRQMVQQLRDSLGVPAAAVDVRRAVRPLSAPHRNGTNPAPWGDLQERLSSFPSATVLAGKAHPSDGGHGRVGNVSRIPARPSPRRLRELPPPWAAYFSTGAVPPIGGYDRSGSTVEAIATGWLVRTGRTVAQAWEVIKSAHPDAMRKARRNWHRWLGVWNRAVADVDAYQSAQEPEAHIADLVQAARLNLHQHLVWSFPPRRRAAVLLVAHALLDRAHNSDKLRVPCPQRDLVQDTGITDRSVIGDALRDLSGSLGVLHTDSFDPSKPDQTSYEFTIQASEPPTSMKRPDSVWVSESSPPRFHTPMPRGVWGSVLPRACHSIWRALTLSQDPLTLWGACLTAGLCTRAGEEPTARQKRTARDLLRQLESAGLALCTADGTWALGEGLHDELATEAGVAYAHLAERIDAERAAHRAGSRSAWSTARAAALKQDRARQVAWWDGLDRTTRTQRSARYRAKFDALSVFAQEDVKAAWANRRARAGSIERTRHLAWVKSQPPERWQAESERRAAQFASLAPPLQLAMVQAWDRHRARFDLPKPSGGHRADVELRAATPNDEARRDRAFLETAAAKRDSSGTIERLRMPS